MRRHALWAPESVAMDLHTLDIHFAVRRPVAGRARYANGQHTPSRQTDGLAASGKQEGKAQVGWSGLLA